MRVKLTTFIQNYNREGIWPEFLLFVYYIHDSAGDLLVPEGIPPPPVVCRGGSRGGGGAPGARPP